MKLFLISFLMILFQACATNDDWDSGANRQGSYYEQQRQEQVESTREQFQGTGESNVEQNQPL